MDILELWYTANENVKWCNHFEKWAIIKQLTIHILYESATLTYLLPKMNKRIWLYKDLWRVFTTVLFTIAQPKITQIFMNYSWIMKYSWLTKKLICYSMSESQNNYSKWKKADKKIHTARKFRGTQSKSVMAKGLIGRGRVGRGVEEREFKRAWENH